MKSNTVPISPGGPLGMATSEHSKPMDATDATKAGRPIEVRFRG